MDNPISTRTVLLRDLRLAIAALFTVFGLIVTITGLTVDEADLAKAQGVNLALWTGLGMLGLAAVFGIWLWRAPPEVPEGHDAGEISPPSGSGTD
ncbi:MAG: hypothetical protein MUE31_14075 [Candidatus Nanopelagicales bacterium]|jgi:hypothetical protein|nr:hypothetical protein [Candidatus Nanopelagicales bacterium]MCU0296187.1 hypothetical protein [Candidatus Nanopelagicales bacterium]